MKEESKQMTRASVIIVNYNGGELLKRCLQSILEALGPNDEVILVDNASVDGSAEAVGAAFPAIRFLPSAVNLGFSAGNNLGVEQARGTYLAFINPDTVAEQGWLDNLIAALEADPQAGLATPKILLLNDPQRINTCGHLVHYTGLTLCRGMGQPRTAFPDLAEVGGVSGAAFVMRRELFLQLGGFDEAFFMYMEDVDLSLRARLAGYRCLYVPSAIIFHSYTLRFRWTKTFYQERNRYLMLLKTFRWPTLLALFPALLLAEVITWGFILLRDRPNRSNKVRAWLWLLNHRNAIMASRRRVQALRAVQDRELIAQAAYILDFEQASQGFLAWVAHWIFDPLFWLFQRLALKLI